MRSPSLQENYLEQQFGLDNPKLNEIRARLEADDKDDIALSSAEARLLQFLIRAFAVKKIVEIGTLYGFSATAMAQALPADGQLITLEKNPEHFAAAAETFRGQSRIQSLLGEACLLLAQVAPQGPFDMVFIDADKGGYAGYLDWAENNVRVGGLIVGDNTFLWGALWDEQAAQQLSAKQVDAMRAFNARLSDPSKYNSILIPTREGLTVAQKLT